MSTTTSDLQLFKYDTSTDGKEVFSISSALNANWDKIDSFASAIKSLSNLSTEGEKRFTDLENSIANKLEADVLLAENGYIKFNNSFILQWGLDTNTSGFHTLNFNISFNSKVFAILQNLYNSTTTTAAWLQTGTESVRNITLSSFDMYSDAYTIERFYMAIGF